MEATTLNRLLIHRNVWERETIKFWYSYLDSLCNHHQTLDNSGTSVKEMAIRGVHFKSFHFILFWDFRESIIFIIISIISVDTILETVRDFFFKFVNIGIQNQCS